MSDFHLGKDFINEFLEDLIKNKYNLNEEQKIQINYMLIDNECGSLNENERSTLSTEIYELNRSSFNNNSIDNNSDNNLIATTRNSSRVSNNLYDNTRNSNFSNNMNNSNDNVYRNSNNSISNSNNINTKLNSMECKNDSDEGSLESIDVEEMKK